MKPNACFFLVLILLASVFGEPVAGFGQDKSDRVLFWSGASLKDWETSEFGTGRDVTDKDGVIQLQAGFPLTGIFSQAKEWPTENYEIELEFQRVEGNDFPCCLTFPVGDSHCSLVIGGWGGTLVGISCIDGIDASANATKKIVSIESGKWYRARVQVRADQINCWIDDDQVVELPTKGLKLTVRNEVRLSRPLGICSFESTAEFKNFKVFTTPAKKRP